MHIRFCALTHRRPRSAIRLVRELVQIAKPPGSTWDALVLDNGSPEEEFRTMMADDVWSDPRLQVRRERKNTFMRGRRILEDLAWEIGGVDDDVVVHLDDDVTLCSDWVLSAVHALGAHGWTACGSVKREGQNLVISGQRSLRRSTEHVAGIPVSFWIWEPQLIGPGSCEVAVEFAGHRALAVRRSSLSRVRHDPDLLVGGEDVDYSLSLRKAGDTIGVSADAQTHHRAHGEGEIPGFRECERVIESWRSFYSKWHFLRRGAHREAGISEEEFVRRVVRRSP